MQTIKAKLSSRKLWVAIIAAAASILVALFDETLTSEVVMALDGVVTAAVAYIFGEGAVDIARLITDAVIAFQKKESSAVPEEKIESSEISEEIAE